MQSVGQKKKNKTHCKMLQCYNYKSARYEVEPITKINLNHESESPTKVSLQKVGTKLLMIS